VCRPDRVCLGVLHGEEEEEGFVACRIHDDLAVAVIVEGKNERLLRTAGNMLCLLSWSISSEESVRTCVRVMRAFHRKLACTTVYNTPPSMAQTWEVEWRSVACFRGGRYWYGTGTIKVFNWVNPMPFLRSFMRLIWLVEGAIYYCASSVSTSSPATSLT
jgi:hypothetical protein